MAANTALRGSGHGCRTSGVEAVCPSPYIMSIIDLLYTPVVAYSSMADELGVTKPEKITLLLSLISGGFGASLDYTLKRDDWERYSLEEKNKMKPSRWISLQLGRLFIGIVVAGFTWGLLFSSMADTKEASIKLIVLCGLAGLSAPAIAGRWKKKGDDAG